MNKYRIRVEEERDYKAVEELCRESFWNVYQPGCTEHYLLHMFHKRGDNIPSLSFVMEMDGRIVGQNLFVNANIKADDGRDVPILTMGPICIENALKRKGYGKALLDYSFAAASGQGYGAVCFEGNIDFYGKSGCQLASKYGLRYHSVPEGEEAGFFLCRELQEGYLKGIKGVYAPPECYFVAERNPEDFEEFDSHFPKKEKLKLPGQLF